MFNQSKRTCGKCENSKVPISNTFFGYFGSLKLLDLSHICNFPTSLGHGLMNFARPSLARTMWFTGALKGFHGLGGSVVAAVYYAFSSIQGLKILLFLAFVSLGIGAGASVFTNIVPWREESEVSGQRKRFRPCE